MAALLGLGLVCGQPLPRPGLAQLVAPGLAAPLYRKAEVRAPGPAAVQREQKRRPGRPPEAIAVARPNRLLLLKVPSPKLALPALRRATVWLHCPLLACSAGSLSWQLPDQPAGNTSASSAAGVPHGTQLVPSSLVSQNGGQEKNRTSPYAARNIPMGVFQKQL